MLLSATVLGPTAVAPAASAATTTSTVVLHTGSTAYARVHNTPGRQAFLGLTPLGRRHFRRLLRGYVIDATCTTLGRTAQGFTSSSESSVAMGGPGFRRPKFRAPIDGSGDFCDIGRARVIVNRQGSSETGIAGAPLDTVALTQKGAAYLDEDRLTGRMFAVLTEAVVRAERDRLRHFPTAQQVAASAPRQIVALASPDASPPHGMIGFYSDGANHAEAATASALGRRLFLDSDAGVLSSNVAEHLLRLFSGSRSLSSAP
ncbi:MAG: hypothetical protein M3Z27_05725 [Actinomycetota bacterium]|nr:hypothetical protein [Actinomycetota bacterium]